MSKVTYTPQIWGGPLPASNITISSTAHSSGSGDYIKLVTGSQQERLRIDSNGRIVSGTLGGGDAIPSNYGDIPVFAFEGGAGASVSYSNWFNDRFPVNFYLTKSRGTTRGSHVILQDGDNLGNLSFGGSDGTQFIAGAEIYAQVDGTPGTNDMPTRLIFATTPDGSDTTVERLRIDSNGVITGNGIRTLLQADTTYYVRKDGSDSNTGLVNNAGGAFLTIGHALSVLKAVNINNKDINIQVATGTYTENLTLGDLDGLINGRVSIFGDGSTPVIDGKIYSQAGSPWQYNLTGFKFQNSTPADCIEADGGFIWITDATWGSATGFAHLTAHNGGIIYLNGNYTINGSAAAHWQSGSGGLVRCRGATVTLSGTPNFTTAFANCDSGGDMQIDANTFVSSATGKRFVINAGGRIKTATSDLTYLPGDAAGTFSGGFYEGIVGASYPITTAPTTQTGATYTVGATDSSIIANRAGTVTLTFPSAANYSGRWIYVKTIQAQTVVSNSSDVVPLAGGAAGTAILGATAGKWAALQSDGTNWVIMAGA